MNEGTNELKSIKIEKEHSGRMGAEMGKNNFGKMNIPCIFMILSGMRQDVHASPPLPFITNTPRNKHPLQRILVMSLFNKNTNGLF